MALHNYPKPDLDITLQEAGRVLQLIMSPDLYMQYKNTLSEQREILQEAQRKLSDACLSRENWVTEQFKGYLLSCDDPIPTSTVMPVVLTQSKAWRDDTSLGRAAALVHAMAKLYSEPLAEGEVPEERTQQSEMFASSRLPGKKQDEIKLYPDSLHAILTCRTGVYPIQILHKPRAGAPLTALPLGDIYHQLELVNNQPAAGKDHDASAICSLSSLPRRDWYGVREQILKKGGPTADSLNLMESAVLALSLEDGPAPPDMASTLNAVKLGAKGWSCLRYYDKVINVVVFKDNTAGLVFEHTVVDGTVGLLVTDCVFNLSESQSRSLIHAQTVNKSAALDANLKSPKPLTFQLEGIVMPSQPAGTSTPETPPILTFEMPFCSDALAILRSQRGVYDAWITFSLQLALRQTLGESAEKHILVTPTHMLHFKHGRCDPTYSFTTSSRQLVSALAACIGPDGNPPYTKELIGLFHLALLEHKNLIKATKSGQGVGPHLGVLRHSVSPNNPLRKFLDLFGCPSVYLTGWKLTEGVECGVGNVYARDQLAVTYVGKKDRVRIVMNGKGSFASVLDKLHSNLQVTLKQVVLLALRYAMAGQMGALECILQGKDERKMNGDAVANICVDESGKSTQSAEMKPGFTLLIHGGAGESLPMNQSVVDVLEFALETALSLGAQVLRKGGSSLDAVERSVVALEDCFFFNAGKGAVYNKDGQHELEASIVDGNGSNSGSVACLCTVKNPVKAARQVMEKSEHSLLIGDGAEEFLHGLPKKDRNKPVGPEYFQTDIRRRQLDIKLNSIQSTKDNHPQTVGAIALDRWGKLAAATSTGGLVGKLKGRVGDTAVMGAGIYADEKVAVTCSGDGDVFLRQTVAQRVASLYSHKGYTLRQACQEVISENLKGCQAGIIAVDHKGEAVIETNAGVMFVASMVNDTIRAEVFRPAVNFSNVIWETDELVAYLQPEPWTPGAAVLTSKSLSGPNCIFQLTVPNCVTMLLGARRVANMLCERLGVQRCALVVLPLPDQPVQIKVLPIHGLKPTWRPHLAEEEEFNHNDPGYCSSKNGPRCEDAELDNIQAKIRAKLQTPNVPYCYDFLGDPSHNNLFSQIVRGEEKHWRVWEDNSHVAFLTPFPNTPGFTVVVPRKPLPSDVFRLKEEDYTALILATRSVAQLLQEGMGARGVALIFEGFEIDYAHTKLVPLVASPCQKFNTVPPQFFQTYPGFVTSANGPVASPEELKKVHAQITRSTAPRSWEDPQSHATLAITNQWYRNLFQIQNTLFHSTVDYFNNLCQYAYALTPITTDTISSPMGLGSDSEPVLITMLGQDVHLADSMQFVLEYFLRFQEGLPGAYYVSPSFRGEDPDATHLNQFYHVECELLGDMDDAIAVAEGFVAHMTQQMLKKHSQIVLSTAGTLSHAQGLLKMLEGGKALPRVTLEQAIPMMPSPDCLEWVQDGQPQFGKKLTRKGERVLIEKYGGAVWLTEMDHLGVPFYQAYVEGSGRSKAKAADLLLGLGETLGLGERHPTSEMVQEALRHHAVPEESYKWYIGMRQVIPLRTSGWGMGTERYLCWLLQHHDVRDMHIIPRMKGKKYMP